MTNNLFELNNENKVLEQLENYLFYGKQPKGNKFVINETPSVLQYAGINPLEIEFSTSVINKAKKIHKMTNDEILNTVKKIADPLLVFDSDKLSTENKRDSILLITDEEVSAENKPSAVSMNVNANETNNRYKINAITSIHGRSLIARNGINIMEEWKNKGLLKYADDKKISSFAKAVSQGEPDIQEQFLLPLATLDIENIPCKSDFVNHQEKVQDISNIATELVLEKLKAANINVITDQNEMQAILDAGINVQKMAAHYGTNQNIENAESFNGYGVYVLSVNEENARYFGLKIAAKKYGNSFYINNQPLQEFLQKRNFSPYWQSVISQVQNPSNETLLHSVMTSDVKGNPVLLKEQNQLSTLCGLNLINYKREQTYLYSVEIPDNDGTNYLYYDKSIGLESAERINTELSKLGTNWQVSRNDTGYSVYFNILSNKVFNSQKQASEFLQKIGYVGMETSTENYIIFDDREMNINNRVQYMITENGELYGFAYNGQIYADKNLMNSNVLAHEYTHLWDNYTKNKNPELWELGKNVFKKTAIWNEVVNDPSYQNIRNNEDEILSECHARIVGKFAQSVLERIAQENGENAKNAVIDWNKEVEAFVAKEFGFSPELGSENYISEAVNAESMKEFLAAPMKDLMNGVVFEKRIEKESLSFEEAQIQYPNIVDLRTKKSLDETFVTNSAQEPVSQETLKKEKSVDGILQTYYSYVGQTDRYKDNFEGEKCQEAINKINILQKHLKENGKLNAADFLKEIQDIMHVSDEKSHTVRHYVNDEQHNLRISNHSANAVHAKFRPDEISVVIKLSSVGFVPSKEAFIAEYVYNSKSLNAEKQENILNGLKDWLNTGNYSDKSFDRDFYSPTKEQYMAHQAEKSKIQKMVLSDKKEQNMNKDGYLFNHEIVERKSLSEADERRLQEDFDVIGNFENAVGQWSEYSNITNFFDFHNHSDEFLKFMDAAREEKEISGHKDNISFVQHYLENKLEIPIYKNGERISPNWTDEEKGRYSSVISRLNLIAQAIVKSNETYTELSSGREGIIHNTEKLELYGAKDITELEKTLQKIKDELNPQYSMKDLMNEMGFEKRIEKNSLYLPRHSWSENLKEVITNTSYQSMIDNRELQIEGKSGNEEAAVELVDKLVNDKIVSQLVNQYPNAIVVPIPSIETADKKPNAIPLAYARKFEKAGLQIADDIIEIDSAHHTGKKSFKRVVNRPHFDGTIEQGREYIIVDDVFAMGGTINSMRNFIEDKGGKVVAVSTLTPSVENSKILAITDENLNSLKSIDQKGDLLNAIRKLDIAENFETLTDPIGKYIVNNREKIINEERTRRAKSNSKTNDEKNQRTDQVNSELTDYTDPIEALEESYNTPLNPPTEEDIEAEKILHDKYIQDELDKTIEDLQANGGLSDAAIEAEIAAQEEAEAYEEDTSYDEEEESVLTFNDTNGNLHFPQEIISILENFQKVESSKWNLPVEEKTAVFHLIQLTEMDKNDFENSLAKLQEYMNTEEFKREEENYAKIFTPILLTSLGQDYDKETQTFSSEKFSYKFSTDGLKEEIPVTKGEIKSILDNDFTGGNIKLTQDFQNELIEKGLVKPEEKFVLINEVEAVAKGTKIKPDQPYVTLTIPVDNNGKTEFVQTKYYHVSSLEEPQKLEKTIDENATQVDKNVIIYGETKVPEFAMITQHGLENFKDMIIDSFEESSGTYLLKSEDGKNNVRVTENTLKTLTSDEYAKKTESYTQDTKTAEKMIDTQYNDFFELRDNCANNFRHNLSVFCRKEANSSLDALKIANHIISEMPKEEKRKTKELLNLLRKDGQSVNEVLIETFHEAVKEIPLNEDYIKHHRYEKMIARPMYDTLSTKGEKIDRDFDLKIGDSVEVVFKVNKDAKTHFLRKESIYQNCTIISSSKENNMVTLMDGNKSFYDVPRDTFLAEYGKQQYKAQKIEHKVHRQQSMQIEIGR